MYVVGIVLVARLFDFQVVHGEEYRQLSSTRLTREMTVTPTRGEILDRTGNVIVGNTMSFELQLYKSKIDNNTLNQTILNIINVLEKNGDTYTNTLPIDLETLEYLYTDDTLENWKKNNNISPEATAEEAINILANSYEIENKDFEERKKIVTIRYRIKNEGYSTKTPIIISRNISRESAIEINERNEEFPGADTISKSIRDYKYRKLSVSYNWIYR